jgi:hypothetical protein
MLDGWLLTGQLCMQMKELFLLEMDGWTDGRPGNLPARICIEETRDKKFLIVEGYSGGSFHGLMKRKSYPLRSSTKFTYVESMTFSITFISFDQLPRSGLVFVHPHVYTHTQL